MKVSVLMPVYKTKELYLRQAIESILTQTFTDFEFLIADDCPDKPVDKIVKSYTDKRIKYLKMKKNMGIAGVRNKLLSLAKGEYIAVMDHDDISLPTRLAEEVAYLDTHLSVGVVGTQYKSIPQGKVSHLFTNNEDIKRYLVQGCAILHPASMMRASVLDENPYEAIYTPAEDYALWCKLLDKTDFYNIPKVLFCYRRHKENTSSLQKERLSKATAKIHKLMAQKYPDLIKQVEEKGRYIVRLKLFKVIPLGHFEQQGKTLSPFLKYLPFVQKKIKFKGL